MTISLSSLLPAIMLGCCTAVEQGKVTMWSTNDALIGAMCEYANPPVDSIEDPVLASYLRSGFHCAIGHSNPDFGLGEQCGKCYRVTSLKNNGQFGTPGSAGSAVVMISNKIAEGGTSHFDCNLAGFKAITGAETGVFDMEFEETACHAVTGTPTVINWADQNEHYCKMMFQNIGGWGSLAAVHACLTKPDGSEDCSAMQRFQGQTWIGCPHGAGTAMRFELTQRSPTNEASSVSCSCTGAWPWPTGQQCSCPSNFVASNDDDEDDDEDDEHDDADDDGDDSDDGTTEALATTTTLVRTTGFLSTAAPVPSCVYDAHANTAVKSQGSGGKKLPRNSYGSEQAYLDACKAECNRDPDCGGFVDDPTNLFRRRCKPKTTTVGYTKQGKTFHVKGSGC